ncbi:polysaccharide pyruvyl transferase family protein [Scatolibacter rhodanostii]|uniref:polysaccharide pyruvyl transferase family protein n=1 Tax=Scatolibacter rhodanostii TaxID=2014781 RepID=UPI000C08BE06|nr:polysaccharide pyruvyl transferase family protein [Scatolibacter rhodanostii]
MKIGCYFHSGSENHGCEAIIRATNSILGNTGEVVVYSFNKQQDQKYRVNEQIAIKEIKKFHKWSLSHIFYYILKKVIRTNKYLIEHTYRPLLNDKVDVALSVGGDTYCYNQSWKELKDINSALKLKGVKTVLWGCSIEPDLLKESAVIEDMNQYSLILARESITYESLLKAEIKHVKLRPDPAFALKSILLDLPTGFIEGNTVGINVSPMIISNEGDKNITMTNYIALMKYILNYTDMNIALIPHVVWESNNDLIPLKELYLLFKNTKRVVLIPDCNAKELKGYISRCRMFIGARTHATIAAYSTNVPTLVVGYSVKAKGIARDIFGTDEDYVIPVQSLQREEDLTKSFEWLQKNENNIRRHLESIMPLYCQEAFKSKDEIDQLSGGNINAN